MRARGPGVSPIEATRKLAHDLLKQDHEFVMLLEDKTWFIKTAMASEALEASALEMRDDFICALAVVLAHTSNRPTGESPVHLAAAQLVVSTWSAAFSEAQKKEF